MAADPGYKAAGLLPNGAMFIAPQFYNAAGTGFGYKNLDDQMLDASLNWANGAGGFTNMASPMMQSIKNSQPLVGGGLLGATAYSGNNPWTGFNPYAGRGNGPGPGGPGAPPPGAGGDGPAPGSGNTPVPPGWTSGPPPGTYPPSPPPSGIPRTGPGAGLPGSGITPNPGGPPPLPNTSGITPAGGPPSLARGLLPTGPTPRSAVASPTTQSGLLNTNPIPQPGAAPNGLNSGGLPLPKSAPSEPYGQGGDPLNVGTSGNGRYSGAELYKFMDQLPPAAKYAFYTTMAGSGQGGNDLSYQAEIALGGNNALSQMINSSRDAGLGGFNPVTGEYTYQDPSNGQWVTKTLNGWNGSAYKGGYSAYGGQY